MIANHMITIDALSLQDAAQAAGSPASLVWAGSVLLGIVLIGMPLLARWFVGKREVPLKGLGLPAGSVRSMLALMTVGVFVVVATFGRAALGSEYERALTVLATLAGPVLGFYFGSRGSGGRAERATSGREQDHS